MERGPRLIKFALLSNTALFILIGAPVMGWICDRWGRKLYIPNQSSWLMAVVSEKRRGLGVGLVTAAMFIGQFFAPIIVQPFIEVGNPKSVWSAARPSDALP